jgi:hypothetical protein
MGNSSKAKTAASNPRRLLALNLDDHHEEQLAGFDDGLVRDTRWHDEHVSG